MEELWDNCRSKLGRLVAFFEIFKHSPLFFAKAEARFRSVHSTRCCPQRQEQALRGGMFCLSGIGCGVRLWAPQTHAPSGQQIHRLTSLALPTASFVQISCARLRLYFEALTVRSSLPLE